MASFLKTHVSQAQMFFSQRSLQHVRTTLFHLILYSQWSPLTLLHPLHIN